jgi:hypothetical protein
VKRRAAQADKNFKLGEGIAEAGKLDSLRLHETQDDASGIATPTCGAA